MLTAEVLRLVNSAYFGLSREVTSINHAVVYVGINTVKNVAIALATKGALPTKNKAGLDMRQFWEHSLTVGIIAKKVMEARGGESKQDANFFVAGLLHDIGKIIFAHFMPDDYKQVIDEIDEAPWSLTRALVAEKNILGFDHGEVGAVLAEKWKLPDDLACSIGCHHKIELASTQSDLLFATASANIISHVIERRESHPDESLSIEVPKVLEDWLGAPVEGILDKICGLDEELEKAKAFIEVN